MIYYTDKARETAQENIKRLVKVIMGMKSSELSFIDALDISSYLTTLSEEIEKRRESKIPFLFLFCFFFIFKNELFILSFLKMIIVDFVFHFLK